MSDLVSRPTGLSDQGWTPQEVSAAPTGVVPPLFTHQAHDQPRKKRGKRGRRLVVTAVVCTMLCALVSRPAYADPGNTVPDQGARPVPNGQIVYPGEGTSSASAGAGYTATPAIGPLASQIMSEDVAVQALGEQVKQLQIDMGTAQDTAKGAQQTWQQAVAKVNDLQARNDSAAADAYKAAAGLGPLGDHANDLHQFSILVPGMGGQPGGDEAARDLLRAQDEEKAAEKAYRLADTAATDATNKFNTTNADFQSRSTALATLKSQNSTEYAQAVAATDAYEQSLGGANLADNQNIDGMQANPKAMEAVNWALSKLGAPYVWGTEGPITFDCSGLAYWSYGKVGVRVPRVANAMYHGTHAIVATRTSRGDLLLPGDLVYFATNPDDWRTIYHMGIYIGGGRMVQAPSTGDVVKISPVSWSHFFGATRIFDPVPKTGAPATPPTGGGSAASTPSPTPSTSHSASPSPSPSVSHSTPPTPPVSPSPSQSTSPSPSASASASHSASPTPKASNSQSSSPSPSVAATKSPSASPAAAASASHSAS
jgi:peptidoglycan DL-endopeptidase CwlO